VQDGLVVYLCSVLRVAACGGGGFIQSKSSERGGRWARGQDEEVDVRKQDKSHSAAGREEGEQGQQALLVCYLACRGNVFSY
jgi:hypothetical protein